MYIGIISFLSFTGIFFLEDSKNPYSVLNLFVKKDKCNSSIGSFDPLILRSFDSSIIGQITIKDKLENRSTSKSSYGKGYLHFHPDVYLEQLNGTTFLINNQIVLTINSDKYNSPVINIEQYSYAKGYNMLIESTVISYSVFKHTKIQLREVN